MVNGGDKIAATYVRYMDITASSDIVLIDAYGNGHGTVSNLTSDNVHHDARPVYGY